MTQLKSLNKIEASQIVQSTLFHTIDFVLVDSTVEYSGPDTTTRVRFVRASKNQQSTYEATESRTQTDTVSEVREEINETPIAVQSKKRGVAWLRPHVRMVFKIIFFIIIMIFVVFVKKVLLLRR